MVHDSMPLPGLVALIARRARDRCQGLQSLATVPRPPSEDGHAAGARRAGAADERRPTLDQLDRAAARRVLHLDALKSPVKIASLELLRNGRTFLVRARSTDGAEGLIVPNADRLRDVHPVFLNRVAPFLVGKDARELEALLAELYRHDS